MPSSSRFPSEPALSDARPALLERIRALRVAAPPEPAQALQLAEQACAAEGEGEVEAWHQRAQLLAETGRKEEALVCWRRALAGPPDPAWGLQAALARIALLEQLDRPKELADTTELALRHAPEHAPLWLRRAMALESLERPAEALAALDRALALEPALPGARYHRARLRARLGQVGPALDDLRDALATEPELAELARAEEDLVPLRADPVWAGLVAAPPPRRKAARPKPKARPKPALSKGKGAKAARPRAKAKAKK